MQRKVSDHSTLMAIRLDESEPLAFMSEQGDCFGELCAAWPGLVHGRTATVAVASLSSHPESPLSTSTSPRGPELTCSSNSTDSADMPRKGSCRVVRLSGPRTRQTLQEYCAGELADRLARYTDATEKALYFKRYAFGRGLTSNASFS
eukprot:SAG31_NODE_3654_length_4021_cov_2.291688_2_plen_148_part_00